MNTKKYIFVLIIGFLVSPVFVQASWWNPVDWFKGETSVAIVEPVKSSNEPSSVLNPGVESLFGDIQRENISLKNQNSKLASQVADLNEQVRSLSSLRDSLINQVNSCPKSPVTETTAYKPDTSPSVSTLTKGQENEKTIQKLIVQIADLRNTQQTNLGNMTRYCLSKYPNIEDGAQRACSKQADDDASVLEKQIETLQNQIFQLEKAN